MRSQQKRVAREVAGDKGEERMAPMLGALHVWVSAHGCLHCPEQLSAGLRVRWPACGCSRDKHRRGACSWVGRETRLHVRGLICRRDGSGAHSRKKQWDGKGRKNETFCKGRNGLLCWLPALGTELRATGRDQRNTVLIPDIYTKALLCVLSQTLLSPLMHFINRYCCSLYVYRQGSSRTKRFSDLTKVTQHSN